MVSPCSTSIDALFDKPIPIDWPASGDGSQRKRKKSLLPMGISKVEELFNEPTMRHRFIIKIKTEGRHSSKSFTVPTNLEAVYGGKFTKGLWIPPNSRSPIPKGFNDEEHYNDAVLERSMFTTSGCVLGRLSTRVYGVQLDVTAANGICEYMEAKRLDGTDRSNLSADKDGTLTLFFRSSLARKESMRGFTAPYLATQNQDGDFKKLEDLKKLQQKKTVFLDERQVELALNAVGGFGEHLRNLVRSAKHEAENVINLHPKGKRGQRKMELVIHQIHFIVQCGGTAEGRSVTFGTHRDTDTALSKHQVISVVVRLSDKGDTFMHVEGAHEVFKYGSECGCASIFAADSFHRSVPALEEQVKVALFFVVKEVEEEVQQVSRLSSKRTKPMKWTIRLCQKPI